MVEFNKAKGGDIEGQIKNNLAKPVKIVEVVENKLETITFYYSCTIERESPNIDAIIDYLNEQRASQSRMEKNHDRELYQYPTPLFYLAMDREGYEILAWSDAEDSVVRTPHKTGDA